MIDFCIHKGYTYPNKDMVTGDKVKPSAKNDVLYGSFAHFLNVKFRFAYMKVRKS